MLRPSHVYEKVSAATTERCWAVQNNKRGESTAQVCRAMCGWLDISQEDREGCGSVKMARQRREMRLANWKCGVPIWGFSFFAVSGSCFETRSKLRW